MTWFSKKIDFLAIGDSVVDDFIKIEEAEIEQNQNGDKGKICMTFGDKIPYESSTLIPAVGNSANAAVSASRLGLSSALVTNLGDDKNGELCIKALRADKVGSQFIKKHAGLRTNYHYVLWYGDDRTILIKHEEYPYALPGIGEPKWIYLSSLGENSLPFHADIVNYLEKHPNIRLAFQPGTYQIRFGTEALKQIYSRAELFFCNKEEAKRILNSDSEDVKTLAEGLHTLGPKTVFITDGRNGAYVLNQRQLLYMPIYPDPKPPLERTGAGDAFSSTVTASIHLGLSVEESMRWALINSMSVVQHIGAQAGLLDRAQIEHYLKQAPADFCARSITKDELRITN